MNEVHKANRRFWNESAEQWERLEDEGGLWQRCPREPEIAFTGGALELVRETAGTISGKDVCVIGSGDNLAAFALSGMGANVTSVDFSEPRLEVAWDRAKRLGLSITFLHADAADLGSVGNAEFDLVYSSNGFFVWVSDLPSVFSEVYRILSAGGHYVFCDTHPFQRPWSDKVKPVEVAKSYWDTGPFMDEANGTFRFHWTLSDLLNASADSGLILERLIESPALDSRFWQEFSYLPGTDDRLLDWKHNPRAALPVWLTAALQKPE